MAKSFKDFVDEYLGTKGTKAKTRKTNPARKVAAKRGAKRKGTAKPNRVSQITKKAPSKRLVTRRKRNTDPGYFPNPHQKKLPYHVDVSKDPHLVVDGRGGVWHGVAEFEKKADAVKYARELATTTNAPIRVVKV